VGDTLLSAAMLKRISVHHLRLGMHLHELCGSWMDHPFWRSKFVLQDPADLVRIRDSGIGEVWINTAKGLDVEGGVSQEQVASEVERELVVALQAPQAAPAEAEPPSPEPAGQSASAICNQARDKVHSLFTEARMGKAIDVEGCAPLVEAIIGSVESDPGALLSLVRLKSKDEYTYLHSVAVCTLMVALARTLKLPDAEVRKLGLAGMLHDMGKARIPLPVLNKPGRLTDAEFALMRRHPQWGHDLLVEGQVDCAVTLDVCLHHHEKIDGSGYPSALAGKTISLPARMGAICDVYDAVTSARAYKQAWDPGEAIRQMAQWKGHFDPVLFQAFVKTVGIYPVGTLIKLQSGRLAVVIEQGARSLLTPRVKVFFSTRSMLPITPELVDLGNPACQDKLLGVESPEAWKFKNLESLWIDEVRAR
jgi:HD-GYP domain-containing protein (c-di-GMP phosphodiesterase class II)